MATTISGTTLSYGSGSSQTAGGGKVISYGYGEYNVRTSLPNTDNYIFWDACTINRTRSDTDLHVVSLMPGHNWNSFPFGGMFVEMKDASGNKYRSYYGAQYLCCGEGANQEITFKVDWTFRDSVINNNTGNWTVHFGWQSYNGGSNRWCNIWNPNASDDSRGYQKSSTCFVEEIIYG